LALGAKLFGEQLIHQRLKGLPSGGYKNWQKNFFQRVDNPRQIEYIGKCAVEGNEA
jgi:hypothetical protein